MLTTDQVSIVVPHYGDPAPALALVEQLRAHAPECQLIVVDDCSPEPFPDTPHVDVVRRALNGGFGAAVNSGARLARGTHLLVLNSDLELPSDFVRELVRRADAWQPAVVGPALLAPDGSHGWSGRHFPTVRHQFIEWLTPLARFRGRLHESVGHDSTCVPGRTAVVDWLMGAALLIPLAEFRVVGGFDESFYMNSEEVDLQRRLRARGVPSVFIGGVSGIHIGGGSSGGSEQRRTWLVKSRRTYAAKWGGRRARVRLQLALTGASVVNVAANGIRELLGREVDAWSTLRHELRWIWR